MPNFDVSFLNFPPVNPKRYPEIDATVSKLFDTSRDKVLKLKKEESLFGGYQENYHELTYDWVLVLNNNVIDIYKIEGLRNFPVKSLQVAIFNRIRLPYDPVSTFTH